MEGAAEYPAHNAKVGETFIVGSERVSGWDLGADSRKPSNVRPEVQEGEKDREGLLNAEDSNEWPFAVVLYDRIRDGRVKSKSLVRDDVLTGVVAFRPAVPEEKAEMESCLTRALERRLERESYIIPKGVAL